MIIGIITILCLTQ